jgi:hypothetical protein
MTPLDAAITWIQKGFSPVPVPHRSKRPVLKEWQRLEITKEGASQYFNGASQNIVCCLFEPAVLGDRIDGWRVCWVGGWDKGKVLFVVMVERVVRGGLSKVSC